MTRKSKRELERAVDRLAETSTSPDDGETVLDTYDEEIRTLVASVARDVIRLGQDPEIANAPQPDRTLLLLERIREKYGIEGDRDEHVHAALEDGAAAVESTNWHPDDVFAPTVCSWPARFDEADRDRFDARLEVGEEDAAAMLVRAAYEQLADRGGATAEVPA